MCNASNTNSLSSSQNEAIEQQRFMYQKAIEAYQYHVNRYHTWMNYYAIFNGALLVAFCTLLCATTQIVGRKDTYDTGKVALENGRIFLSNNYEYLQVLIIFIGILTSFLWLLSIFGHRVWTLNWMYLICNYEEKYGYEPLYRIIILQKKYNPKRKDSSSLRGDFRDKYVPEGFSTDKLTIKFVWSVIISWYIALFYLYTQDVISLCVFFTIVIIPLIVKFLIHILRYCNSGFLDKFLYSDISSKKKKYEK
jgi:hypothetical protein